MASAKKVLAELCKAVDIEVGPETASLHKKLVNKIGKLDEKDWDELSGPAQKWFNKAAAAYNKEKEIPSIDDVINASDDDDDDDDGKSSKGKDKGGKSKSKDKDDDDDDDDKKSKKSKDKDDDDDDDDDDGKSKSKDKDDDDDDDDDDDGKKSKSKKKDDDDDAGGKSVKASRIEKGMNVKIKTEDDETVVGVVSKVIEGKSIRVKDEDDEETKVNLDEIKSCVLVEDKSKSKKKDGDDDDDDDKGKGKSKRRGKSKDDDDDDDGGKRKRQTQKGGESATSVITAFMASNPGATIEKLKKHLDKKEMEVRDVTLRLQYTSNRKLLDALKEADKLDF